MRKNWVGPDPSEGGCDLCPAFVYSPRLPGATWEPQIWGAQSRVARPYPKLPQSFPLCPPCPACSEKKCPWLLAERVMEGEKQVATQMVLQPPGLPPASVGRRSMGMSGWGMVGGNETVTLTCLMATKHFQSQTSSPSDVGRHSPTLPSNVRRSPQIWAPAHPFLPLPNLP